MKNERKFAVDFYLAGTVMVKAKNKEDALRKASLMDVDTLTDCIENSGFGKEYFEEI